MQLAVIIKGREFTIYVRERGRGRKVQWEASIADWQLRVIREEVYVAPTEQAAAYMAWLALADRYGTPDNLSAGCLRLAAEAHARRSRRRHAEAGPALERRN